MSNPFSTIEEAVDAIREGRIVIVVDAEDRENEGDFICAAEKVTPEIVNFMITHGRGQLCMPILPEVSQRLELPPMVEAEHGPAGHQLHGAGRPSLDHAPASRPPSGPRTIQAICDPDEQADRLHSARPLFPLVAKEGGVLRRAGHTEAAVDLARMAGLHAGRRAVRDPRRDGRPGQPRRSCTTWPSSFDLPIISIEQLIAYRRVREKLVYRRPRPGCPPSTAPARSSPTA